MSKKKDQPIQRNPKDQSDKGLEKALEEMRKRAEKSRNKK